MWTILLRIDGDSTKPPPRDRAVHSSVLGFSLAPLNLPEKLSPSSFLPFPCDIMDSSPSCCKIQRAQSLAAMDGGVGRTRLEALITYLPSAHHPHPPIWPGGRYVN